MGSTRVRVISGFNHNLRYKGRIYHIQTEEGGKENPTIVTHAFLGGVILSTVRQPCNDLLSRTDREEAIRERMKLQHLEEIRKLFSGAFDSLVENAADDD